MPESDPPYAERNDRIDKNRESLNLTMPKHLNIKISGQVQGVGFRWCSYEKFVELDLVGTAENKPDGSVEITAQGEVEELKKFLSWAKRGPEGSRVENMDYKEIEQEVQVVAEEKKEE